MKTLCLTILFILALICSSYAQNEVATCMLQPTENAKSGVAGNITFSADNGQVTVDVDIVGFDPDQSRALHIHSFGDLSESDGTSLGGHFGSDGQMHALPSESNDTITRHFGDMGNFDADSEGNVKSSKTFSNFQFTGPNSVLGRGMVLHAGEDQGFAEQPSGAAGSRGQVCVIGKSKIAGGPVEQPVEDRLGRFVIRGSDVEAIVDITSEDSDTIKVEGYAEGFPEGTHTLKAYSDGDLVNGFGTEDFSQDITVEDSSKQTCISFTAPATLANIFGSGVAIEPADGSDPYRAVIGVKNPSEPLAECEAGSDTTGNNGNSLTVSTFLVVLMLVQFLFF